MPKPSFLTIAEQVAAHLRTELACGKWRGTMPGVPTLTTELGVNGKTIESALRLLENEGTLVGQGPGRRRRIALAPGVRNPQRLRVGILLLESVDRGEDFMIELRHLLEESGHLPFYAHRTLLDLGMDVMRVSRFVKQTEADAWIVVAGSHEVLHWFSQFPRPAFALFGRRDGLPIAAVGPDKAPALAKATRRLIELGHRRISLLIRKHHRLPEPSPFVRAFLDELRGLGSK